MGANRQQGWALLLFLIGFTFLVAGLLALGPIFALAGLAGLVASAIWFIRIKPLELEGGKKGELVDKGAAASKQAVRA